MADQGSAPPNVRQAVPFFHVKDMPAALRFYVDGLGFTAKITWTPDDPSQVRWCWLELGGAALMLQAFWRDGAPGGWPSDQLGQGVSVCFMCEDALAVRREALARGLQPSQRPFVGNGLWVVSYVDPDGYRIDFESPTDVAEETEYDESIHS